MEAMHEAGTGASEEETPQVEQGLAESVQASEPEEAVAPVEVVPVQIVEAEAKPVSASLKLEDVGGFRGQLLQAGMVETVLCLILLAWGGMALMQDHYGRDLNMKLGGGFIGIWVFGAVLRWVLKRAWNVT